MMGVTPVVGNKPIQDVRPANIGFTESNEGKIIDMLLPEQNMSDIPMPDEVTRLA